MREHISKLPNELEAETLEAKLFDMLCYNIELAVLNKDAKAVLAYANKVIEIASKLESKENIPVVAAQIKLIQDIQTEAYWEGITVPMLESMRKRIRGLVKLIEKQPLRLCIPCWMMKLVKQLKLISQWFQVG